MGIWEFIENPKYNVTHEFISGTPGKELPEEVLALIPSDQNNKEDGSVVTPDTIANKEIVVEGGKWVFKLWDAEQKNINSADEKFVGTWVFVEAEDTDDSGDTDGSGDTDDTGNTDGSDDTGNTDSDEKPGNQVTPGLGDRIDTNIWYAMSFISMLIVVFCVVKKKYVVKTK